MIPISEAVPERHDEERIFVRATGTPTLRAATGVAAGAVDPVAEARLREQPRADDRQADPPEHLHLEGLAA